MRTAVILLFLAVSTPSLLSAQSPSTSDQPFVVEYYYKAKWGHADEFLTLFKKNHYPVLKKEIEMGRLLKVWMDQPRYHMTEDARWDFRVTIVFKNATVANEPVDEAALQKQLYPDQETFHREEQRRFEILDSHWDLPVRSVDLDKWRRVPCTELCAAGAAVSCHYGNFSRKNCLVAQLRADQLSRAHTSRVSRRSYAGDTISSASQSLLPLSSIPYPVLVGRGPNPVWIASVALSGTGAIGLSLVEVRAIGPSLPVITPGILYRRHRNLELDMTDADR